jgi:formate hydrogenlyase subunit 3/multisubunit Na+/H+ antiporter MnhD subunit
MLCVNFYFKKVPTLIMSFHFNESLICKFLTIVLITILNLITYFFLLLFLIDINSFLYPYTDIGGSLYPYVVDLDVLDGKILFSIICFLCGSVSAGISYRTVRKSNPGKVFRLFLIIMMMLSLIAILFSVYRFIELNNLSSSLVRCDQFSGQSPGCYMP